MAAASSPEKKPTDFVTLVSSDGFEFHITRECATVAKMTQSMLDPSNDFREAKTDRMTFETINGVILEKICEYFAYNVKFRGAQDVPDMDIPPELCLELLVAADYLTT